jgi:hypothetical protein
VFLRVTPMTGVGRALRLKKLTPKFIGPYQISDRVGTVAYRVDLPPHLSNLHDVFHVSQLRKYVADPSHVISRDDVLVRDNLMMESYPELLLEVNFRGRKFFKLGRVVTPVVNYLII